MTEDTKSGQESESPEQVSAREALELMKKFVERKDKFVDAVKTGKNRSVPAGKEDERLQQPL
jgi:hypothetical protein